jgi:hypothetical protein
MATDFLVDTPNPAAVDQTLQQLPMGGAVLIQDNAAEDGYLRRSGHYVMRVFRDPGFVKFACEQQGYCKIVAQLHENV